MYRFPPRAPPVASPANRGHQSTPLARLSPSSEMSAQQPRILTLHDISGKPLQTALLATTSSSGGVGKDVLHSNSERSLNSPVMSQLSGQSSNRFDLISWVCVSKVIDWLILGKRQRRPQLTPIRQRWGLRPRKSKD